MTSQRTHSTPRVLAPFTFPRTGHAVPNRLVLAAMTNKQSHDDGTLGDDDNQCRALARERNGRRHYRNGWLCLR